MPLTSEDYLSVSEQDQFVFHKKLKGWPLCPHCGAVVRAGTRHRALRASEMRPGEPGLWEKSTTIAFGRDFQLERF